MNVLTVIVGLLGGVVLLGIIVIYYGLNHVYENNRTPHQNTPAKFDIAFEEVHIPTAKNLNLYGWLIPGSPKMPTLILVHGWNRNLERMMVYIRRLHERGYNLLAFDSRNHGSSDPDEYSSMLKFSEDILSVAEYLETEKNAGNQLGIIGLSIGGAASIFAASLDSRLKAVMTVGAFAHPRDIMNLEFKRRHIPYFPLAWLIFKSMERRIGRTFSSFAPVRNIQKSAADFLLVHGEDDKTVPVEQAYKLKNAADSERVRLWVIPGMGHSDCHRAPGFWQRTDEFFRSVFGIRD
ncbi:MAG: alpha/beta fold hydrolase [FCB group bacterium]|nr:alpha/beta fold hydrolase [FCB group bacterium]